MKYLYVLNIGRTRLANRRGAAFLLAIYFASLMFLLLGGISLQRTMIETHAAQISRDFQQTFFLADGAVDSALANIRKQSLLNGVKYYPTGLAGSFSNTPLSLAAYLISGLQLPPALTMMDRASFTIQTLSGKVLSNGEQDVTRYIAATGTTSSGKQANISAYYEEEGPVDGIWANGMIIIHGGANPEDIMATGGMHSGLGAIATTGDLLPTNSPLLLPPRGLIDLVGLKRFTGLTLGGAAYVKNLKTLETTISPELRGIKNGYKCRQLSVCVGQLDMMEWNGLTQVPPYQILATPIPSTIDEQDGTMDYHNPPNNALSIPYSKTLARVDGNAELGMVQRIHPVRAPSGMPCGGILKVPSSGLIIGNGWPGVGMGGVGRDVDSNAATITLCVQAIVPEEETYVIDALIDSPPQVTFTAPAQVFVTGSQYYNFSETIPGPNPPQPRFRIHTPTALAAFGASFPAAMALPFAGMSLELDVSVGVTIQAPKGVEVVVTDQWLPHGRHSLVRVRPGAQFVGSIYAPKSLVAVAPRDHPPTDATTGKVIPYQMKSIVGHDVIVELQGDRIKLGWDADPNAKPPTVKRILSWRNGLPAPTTTNTVNPLTYPASVAACLARSNVPGCY